MGRPAKNPIGAVGRLLDEWKTTQVNRWGKGAPTDEDLANDLGVSDSLISDWRYMRSQLQPRHMANLKKVTGIGIADWAAAEEVDLPTILTHLAARRSSERPPRGPKVQSGD